MRRLGTAALALMALMSLSAPAMAQVVRDFSPRFVANDRGDVRLFGNTVTSCTSNQSPTCAAIQNDTALTDLNNNDHFISFVDVDADPTTFNSSAATVSFPAGATLLFAGLYWGGETGGFGISRQVAPDASRKNQVQLLTPASGTYQPILANSCDETALGSEFGVYYQCFANVTSLVTSGGVGAYTVANVQTSNGFNSHGGWGLVLVYRDPAEPVRNLIVYDGFAAVTVDSSMNENALEIDVAGFTTPFSGTVSTHLGIISYEGDRQLGNARASIDGVPLGDAMNPANNIFNSSNSSLGTSPSGRNPSHVNQLGFDIDLLDATGVLGNNVSTARIRLETQGDFYYPGALAFATEIYSPSLTFDKSVTDLNGGEVEPGDVLEYTLTLENTGLDPADDVVVNDTLHALLDIEPGSITIDGAAQSLALDSDRAEYIVNSRTLRVRVGAGANASQGGTLPANASTVVTFRARVSTTASSGSSLTNQAQVRYTGRTLGNTVTDLSDDPVRPGDIDTTHVTIDMVAPEVDINTPASGSAIATTTPPISGTGEPGANIEVFDGATRIGTTTVAQDGTWTLTPSSPLSEGAHSVRVIAKDAAGNTATDSVTFTIDTTAPPLSIDAPAAGASLRDRRPEIRGTSEPGASVEVFVDGVSLGTVIADGQGNWSITPGSDLSEGDHMVRVTTSDDLNNETESSITFTVDTTAPRVTITMPSDNDTTADDTPTITGTAEPGSTVTISVDGMDPVTVSVNPDGSWSHTPATSIGDGDHVITVTATDDAGNQSTDDVRIKIDTTPPAVAIDAPTAGSTIDHDTPAITGTAEPGSSVEVSIDGEVVTTVTADANGAWSYTPQMPLGMGPHTVTAIATDDIGNSATANTSFTVELPIELVVDITTPENGATVNTTRPVISGTATPETSIQLTVDTSEPATIPVDDQGMWTYTPPVPLAIGMHRAIATLGDARDEVTFIIDAMPPTLMILTPVQDARLAKAPLITGSSDPNAVITLTIDDLPNAQVTANDQGMWTYLPDPMAPGRHTVTAKTTDDQGLDAMDSVSFDIVQEGEPTSPGGPTDNTGLILSGGPDCDCSTTQAPQPVTPLAILAMVFGLFWRRRSTS